MGSCPRPRSKTTMQPSDSAQYRGISSGHLKLACGVPTPNRLHVVSTVFRFVEQTWTSAVRAALIQSSFPSAPATFQEVIGSGHVLERMWSGTSPFGPAASRTTACPFGPAWPASSGCPSTGFFPPTYQPERANVPPSHTATQAALGGGFFLGCQCPSR
jgi:hypothetical protein